jgi:hypothetical protein
VKKLFSGEKSDESRFRTSKGKSKFTSENEFAAGRPRMGVKE